jgi:hypothetical protein
VKDREAVAPSVHLGEKAKAVTVTLDVQDPVLDLHV